MKPRPKSSVAAITLLALAATTTPWLRSWNGEGEWQDAIVGSGSDRAMFEASTQPPQHLVPTSPDSAQDGDEEMGAIRERAYSALVNKGHEPGTDRFEHLLERKVQLRLRKRQEHLDAANRGGREDTWAERRRRVLDKLDRGKETWVRGDYIPMLHRKGGWGTNAWGRGGEVKAAEEKAAEFEEKQRIEKSKDDYEPLTVCGRPADVGSVENFAFLQRYAQCDEITQDKPILVLQGISSFGRTGNNLVEFLHAIQQARDGGIQLGITSRSWAMRLLTQMWMAVEDDDWESQFERTFCVKVFRYESDLKGWDVVHKDTKELFQWRSSLPLGEYIDSQGYSLRTLFKNYNTGTGKDRVGRPAGDMCSGIDAVFGERRDGAIYSVIHSRSLEGEPGYRILGKLSWKSGCDPAAALEMRPDYVRSILEPLGMMEYPIVLITDGQNREVIERLRDDPDVGPLIRLVPPGACWIGGDLTLGVMSNVFIGNPASSFTGFIAKARMALGFGHNYLFRAKDDDGQWRTVCGDHCIYDQTIMGYMA